jgi:regulator of replication initiation timing
MPKELKDLVSFRERSLMRQVEELKKQLKESTNENEKQLEREMLKLK